MRKAYESGQPGRCMMHSKLMLLGNFLSHTLLRMPSHARKARPNLEPQKPPRARHRVPHAGRSYERPRPRGASAECGIRAIWPCQGANVSRGPCSAPGRKNGVESRNRLQKHRRRKVSEGKTIRIGRIRLSKYLRMPLICFYKTLKLNFYH